MNIFLPSFLLALTDSPILINVSPLILFSDYMDRIVDELENSATPPVPASISFRTSNPAHSMIPSSMNQKSSHAEASSNAPQSIDVQVQPSANSDQVVSVIAENSSSCNSTTQDLSNGSESTCKSVNPDFESTNLSVKGDSVGM